MLRPSVWLPLAFLREMLRFLLLYFTGGRWIQGRKREVWTYSGKTSTEDARISIFGAIDTHSQKMACTT